MSGALKRVASLSNGRILRCPACALPLLEPDILVRNLVRDGRGRGEGRGVIEDLLRRTATMKRLYLHVPLFARCSVTATVFSGFSRIARAWSLSVSDLLLVSAWHLLCIPVTVEGG
jgi:hypothetical protein